jgi:hypothetical protein
MIKRMIKGIRQRIDAKASEGVPGLTDDQGPSDGKSDGKASKGRTEIRASWRQRRDAAACPTGAPSVRGTGTGRSSGRTHAVRFGRYAGRMTVRDLLTALQVLPRDAELLAFEAGCENYCEREVDEVEWQGGRVYLHLGARRDDPPRR